VREPSKVSACNVPKVSPSSGFGTTSFHEIQDLLQIQSSLKAQREDIKRIDSNGFKIVSALDTKVVRVEEQVGKLKDSLGSFRSDIAGTQEDLASLKAEVGEVKRAAQNKGPLAGLEKRLASTDKFLQDVQRDVGALEEKLGQELSGVNVELQRQKKDIDGLKADIRGRTSARDHAKDMAALRTEMLQMRRQMDEMRSKTVERVGAPFPAKELDILASNIAKIGARASQVETLQMEFEILKGRIERSEASRQVSSDERLAGHATEARSLPPYTDSPLARRKRASSNADTITAADSLFKRQAFSSGFNASQVSVYDVPSGWAGESASHAGQEKHGENEVTPAHKLTKSGKVDKRTQRPRRSLNSKPK
jgi:archaellum component FlaC